MLYAALILSGILFVVANIAAAYSRWPRAVVLISGTALSVASCVNNSLAAPATPLLTLLFCLFLSFSRKQFLPMSIVAFSIVFVLCLIQGDEMPEYAELRKRYPFESMENRLPVHSADAQKAGAVFESRILDSLEEEIETELKQNSRASKLQMMHEATIRRFIRSSDFGSMRMRDPRMSVISQPAFPVGKGASVDNPESSAPMVTQAILSTMHQKSIVDFVYPDGWGYVKDRQHVAGFQSHRFSKVPEPWGNIQVASIELIGWLRGTPVAYVSENLPAMNELRNAPTRSLDSFEEEALAALRSGKELFVKPSDGGERLLGAIRATKQCIECHGGQRGDLLGAFSYQLR